jgi:hypothetical protein
MQKLPIIADFQCRIFGFEVSVLSIRNPFYIQRGIHAAR